MKFLGAAAPLPRYFFLSLRTFSINSSMVLIVSSGVPPILPLVRYLPSTTTAGTPDRPNPWTCAGPGHLVLNRERVVGIDEFLPVHPLFRYPVEQYLVLGQINLVAMDGVVDFVMQLVSYAKRFQRVKSFCAGNPVCAKDSGNITKAYVFRHPFQPGLDARMKFVAVRATVPEEFDNFDVFPYPLAEDGAGPCNPSLRQFRRERGNTGELMPVSKRTAASKRNEFIFFSLR